MTRNNLVESIDLNGNHDLNFYDGCEYGKHDNAPFLFNDGFHAKIKFEQYPWQFHQMVKHFDLHWFFKKKTFIYTMKYKFIMFDKFKGFQNFGGKWDWKENQGD